MTAVDRTRRPPGRRGGVAGLLTPRRIVTSVLIAAALALLVVGLSGTRPASTPVTYNDPAVLTVEPQPNVLALRQEAITVSLKPNFALAQEDAPGLYINGAGIPKDEIQIQPSLNEWSYLPGPGKTVSALPPGRNCVTAIIKVASDPTDQGHRFPWCFNSH